MNVLSAVVQAWRSWKNARVVALLAILALALGIGSTTAIYTAVRGVMLKPLPYAHGERFVILLSGSANLPEKRGSSIFADMRKYQERTNSFDAYGWFAPDNFNLTAPGDPQHLQGLRVTASLVHELGVAPALGQWFRDDSGIVISNSLWRRLGADPEIVGKTIALNERSYSVSGVMPPRFRLPAPGPGLEGSRPDVWIALNPSGEEDPRAGYYFAYARLKPGVTRGQAEADVRRVGAQIAAEEPNSHHAYFPYLDDLQEAGFKEVRPTLLLLFGSAALLLLITCANVAALLLARSVARARETAIRLALGASRGQLALHYFLEGILVALAGAVLGVLLSMALVDMFVALATNYIPRADEITLDWSVILFAFAAGVLASVLFSSAPLWQASRILPAEVLSDGVRASAGARSRILSRGLVVAEISLAFALLAIGLGLTIHLRNLTRTPPGFDPENLVTFQITLPEQMVQDQGQRVDAQVRLSQAIEGVPGVLNAGLANQLPLGCCFSTVLYPEGRQEVTTDVRNDVSYMTVTPGYFQTMKVPLRSGRFLEMNDASEELLRVMINEAAARRYWPNENPVGAFGRLSTPDGSRFQIVGVVGDVRNEGLNDPTVPEIYLMSFLVAVNPMRFVVRSNLPLPALIPEIRRAVSNVNATLPIHDVKPMHEVVAESVTLQRVGSLMTGFFALAALLMATLGVFGVVSYSVRQRTIEIGTRMALGADRRDVISLIVGGGLQMAATGIVLGIAAAIAAAIPLAEALKIHDLSVWPLVYATAVITTVSLAASFFPAWRASLLSPLVAIRDDPRAMWQSARESIQHAVEGISHLVGAGGEPEQLPEGALLQEFTEAARRAESFREAMRIVLEALRNTVRAESILLLEKVSEYHYRPVVAAPAGRLRDIAIPASGFLMNRLRFNSSPLPLNPADYESWLRWARENRPENIVELEALEAIGARMAVPLRAKQEIVGLLLLRAPSEGEQYSAAVRNVLRSSAGQFALMIENARLTDRAIEHQKLRSDLELAAEVQRRLLPERAPLLEGYTVTGMSLPARAIGGDYFDFIELGNQHLGIALADVSGKGIAAALIMSVVQASLRVLVAEEGITLPELAAKLNNYLHRATGSNKYATFFYAELDGRTRLLRYVNAGHNPPYLVRSGEIEQLTAGGPVVGLFPHMSYVAGSVDLRVGDVLVIFTDGVTEAMNPREEEYGEERLRRLLMEAAALPVDEIAAKISQELRTWIDHAEQFDDLTFLVLKVNE